MTGMKKTVSLALAFLLCLYLAMPATAAETAAVMKLTKTEGTVAVSKSNGKEVSLRADLRLYNGYNVTTAAKSYAWINLDSTKLMKLDASSSVEVRKNGSKLEVNVKSGTVSFDVSEKLGSDESLNVSTSTMAVGIRGTCGWVRVTDQWESEICLLEGTSQCVVADPVSGQMKSAVLTGGDVARCVVYPQDKQGDKCDILMERQTTEGIPGFVLSELVQNVELCDKILDDSGIDVLSDLAKEAGGDPSGRTPDGKSASPEVLGQAQRVQAGEETETAQKLEEIRKEEESQENNISKDPVWEQGEQPSTGGSFGGGSGGGAAPGTGSYTVTFDYGDGTTATQTTNADNKLDSLPVGADNIDGDGAFEWFTAPSGGTQVTDSTVFNSDQTVYARWDGSWMFNTTTGHLTVFKDAGMLSRAPKWDMYILDIKTVDIRPSVTYIGSGAFAGCRNLTDVTIPDSVTSIGNAAFAGCVSLNSVTIPDSVTEIVAGTFMNCSGLAEITIPGSVEAIGMEAFSGCTGLTDVTVPASVTKLDSAVFLGCTSLASVTIRGSLASIEHEMFSGCTGLISVDIPGSVTGIGYSTFSGCNSLKDINYGNTRDEWETKINYVLPEGVTVRCTNGDTPCFVTFDRQDGSIAEPLKVVGYYRINTSTSETREGYAFGGWYKEPACVNQWDDYNDIVTESITLYAKWKPLTITFNTNGLPAPTTNPAPSEADANGKLTSLPSLASGNANCEFSGWYTDPTGGEEVTANTVFNEDKTVYAHWRGWELNGTELRIYGQGKTFSTNYSSSTRPWEAHKETIKTAKIEDGVTSIGPYAFESYKNLDSVEIADSVISIGQGAFRYSGLSKVNIPASVTSIGDRAFAAYEHLAEITVDADNPSFAAVDNVLFSKDMKKLIQYPGGSANTSYSIPSGVTTIDGAFYYCGKLTSVTIPTGVTSIGAQTFMFCGIRNIDIPEGVTTIGSGAFDQSSLITARIPASVTSISGNAFSSNFSLQSITVADGNPNYCTVDGVLFNGDKTQLICYPMKKTDGSYEIPNGVQSIAKNAFSYAASTHGNLTSVTIPSSVTSIEGQAFNNSGNLTTINFSGTQAQWNSITINSSSGLSGKTVRFSDGTTAIIS